MDSGTSERGRTSLVEDHIARETKNFPPPDSQNQDGGTDMSAIVAAKAHKKTSSKESPRSSLNSLNKFKSQIKKPSHRNSSPLNLGPRRKGDSYLQRKIKQLQEESGMASTLVETLGTSNPHYCRILREKMAARQAAAGAMEARKAAMVEASWCRILKAARIPCEEAEELLLRAEKSLAEALEAATTKGVMMYNTIDYPLKELVTETSAARSKSSTHTVKASFESAFEVDRQVASAVKTAFARLAADCPSSLNKEEYVSLLRKISEKPDADGRSQELSDVTSESESDGGLKFELVSDDSSISSKDAETRLMRFGKSQIPSKYDKVGLVRIMFERLKCLKEEELASLATIVATCGLNAALAEVENQQHGQITYDNRKPRRTSCFGGIVGRQQSDVAFSSLDKCLIKHKTKLETEKTELKRKIEKISEFDENDSSEELQAGKGGQVKQRVEEVPSLDKVLVKRVSRLEKEVQEARSRRNGSSSQRITHNVAELDEKKPDAEKQIGKGRRMNQKIEEVPSLEKCLVKRVSRLEREVQEAKCGKNDSSIQNASKKASSPSELEENQNSSCSVAEIAEKENIDMNENSRIHHAGQNEKSVELGKDEDNLVKPKSMIAAAQHHVDQPKNSISRRAARQRELEEAWGGMSLANSIRPHVSRLQKEKAAWIKAEEERNAAMRNRVLS